MSATRDYAEIRAAAVRLTHDYRRLGRQMANLAWALEHGPVTEREQFGLHLAVSHIREGRMDLATEDLAWLASPV